MTGLHVGGGIVGLFERGGAQQHAYQTDGSKDGEHDAPGPQGADTQILDQVDKQGSRVHEGAGAHEEGGTDAVVSHAIPGIGDDLRNEGIAGDKEEGIGGIVGDKEEAHPNGICRRPLAEGRHKDHEDGHRVGHRRPFQEGHSAPVLVGAAVGEIGHPRIGDGVDHLAQSGEQRHNGNEAQQLVLGQQIGQSALYSGLEKVKQIVADHAVEQALGHVRKAVAYHFTAG